MTTVLAAAGASSQFDWSAWIGPFATIVATIVAGIFGPQWLNRRNMKATSAAQAKKDEAIAAQVVEQASVSLINEWRLIAEHAKTQLGQSRDEMDRLRASAVQAELAAENANKRAQAAEMHSVHAEQRAREADAHIMRLQERVQALEDRLRAAGIPLD